LNRTPELERLFSPSSIAVVGASKDESKSGGQFLKSLIDRGFKGTLYPVNPRESEIMGLTNYHSILDVPGEVELAILTVPARTVPQVMAECSQKRVRFAVVHSAGFSELGAEGKELEETMLKLASEGGTRIIGPNCMGIYSPKAHINTIAPAAIPEDEIGSVALIGQSGWLTQSMIPIGYQRGIRFSKVVSIGNQSDLTIEDMLEYLADDADTRVIALYVEGVKQGRRFLQLAKKISEHKPIVAWKAGRTSAGVRAAASHTGSLAGNNVVFDVALKQGGIAVARNLDELIDLTVGFTCPVLPQGNKVGVLVEAGGEGVACADAAESLGLELSPLSKPTQEKLADSLKGLIPPFSIPTNPVDLIWPPVENRDELFLRCLEILLKEFDAVIMEIYIYNEQFAQKVRGLVDRIGKPIFVVIEHPSEHSDWMSMLTRNGIPSFTIPDRAAKAMAAMVRYSDYRQPDGFAVA